jgi:hypothetical protein
MDDLITGVAGTAASCQDRGRSGGTLATTTVGWPCCPACAPWMPRLEEFRWLLWVDRARRDDTPVSLGGMSDDERVFCGAR